MGLQERLTCLLTTCRDHPLRPLLQRNPLTPATNQSENIALPPLLLGDVFTCLMPGHMPRLENWRPGHTTDEPNTKSTSRAQPSKVPRCKSAPEAKSACTRQWLLRRANAALQGKSPSTERRRKRCRLVPATLRAQGVPVGHHALVAILDARQDLLKESPGLATLQARARISGGGTSQCRAVADWIGIKSQPPPRHPNAFEEKAERARGRHEAA